MIQATGPVPEARYAANAIYLPPAERVFHYTDFRHMGYPFLLFDFRLQVLYNSLINQ